MKWITDYVKALTPESRKRFNGVVMFIGICFGLYLLMMGWQGERAFMSAKPPSEKWVETQDTDIIFDTGVSIPEMPIEVLAQ